MEARMNTATAKPADLAGEAHWNDVYARHTANPPRRWKPSDYNSRCLERMFEDVLATRRVESMLEIGCGDSTWLGYLAKKHGISKVAGLDYAASGADMARRRLADAGVSGDIFCQDMFTADAGDVGQYDLVYSLGVVEHFSDLEGAIEAIYRFVKPGGMLLCEVPNLPSIHGLLSWLYQPKVLKKHQALTLGRLRKAFAALEIDGIRASRLGLFSMDLVAWGIEPRFPALDRHLLPLVFSLRRRSDRILNRFNSFRGVPMLAPFLYAMGEKPASKAA
jgi:SAM-dependent methyltransferase